MAPIWLIRRTKKKIQSAINQEIKIIIKELNFFFTILNYFCIQPLISSYSIENTDFQLDKPNEGIQRKQYFIKNKTVIKSVGSLLGWAPAFLVKNMLLKRILQFMSSFVDYNQ